MSTRAPSAVARPAGAAPRLGVRALTKTFGGVVALAPLTLELQAATVHGILGENGAGKSTLVRLIAGALRPDGGTIEVDGIALAAGEPRAARAAGIGVVHQHFALVGALSVAENLRLGRPEATGRIVAPRRLIVEAEALARRHGFAIGDPRRPCRDLPVGVQARVEILRALSGAPRVLLLDEPTAVLTPPEIAELFATIRTLRAAGLLVVFITHKLDEALALCDTISVLRAGRLVTTVPAGALSPPELVRAMVGAATAAPGAPPPPSPTGAPTAPGHTEPPLAVASTPASLAARAAATPAFAVRRLATRGRRGALALDAITFTLDAGEIVGVAGVDGNGQTELAGALYGLDAHAGTVTIDGTVLPPDDVRAAQRAGVALIAADRRRDALAPALTVWENALLAAPLLRRFTRRTLLDTRGARAFAARIVAEYRITPASVDQAVATLSGGNQQRLVIGRALAQRPRVLVAVNPTRGLDIAATGHVHATLARAARAGAAVLLISTDLEELLALSTRLFALYRGRLAGPVSPAERDRLGALMAGLDA